MTRIFPSVFLSLQFLVAVDLVSASQGNNQIARLRRSRRQNEKDGITCELPPHPANGKWSILNGNGNPGEHVKRDTTLKFECNAEYKLSSRTPFFVCDKHWSLSKIPICEKKCPAKYSNPTTTIMCEDKFGQDISCQDAVDGTYLTYRCAPFYETPFGYKKTILCVDGTWNFPNPVCQPVCGKKIEKDTIQLVVGGTIKEKREYPWITAVFQKKNDAFNNVCGGSLLSQRIVVTAAHCVTNNFGDTLSTEQFMVGTGKYYNNFRDSRDVSAQYSEVVRIVVQSGYRGSFQRFFADIALLVTKDLITINEVVQPVCYQDLTSIHLQPGKIGVLAGWGKTESGDQPDELRTLEIPYKHQTVCSQELPSDWAYKFNTADKICAGFLNQNKSACSGDSGGGLYFNNSENHRFYIHGVVSVAPAENGDCNPQQNTLYTSVVYHYEFVDREVTKQYAEQCSLPAHPNNGRWIVPKQNKRPGDIVPSTTRLKVECNEGYGLSSNDATIMCQSAYAMPQCELLCPKLTFPKGTTYKCSNEKGEEVDCSKAIHGSTLTYSCPDGYGMPLGTGNVRFCGKGSWGSGKPECIAEEGAMQSTDLGEKKVVCSYASWYAFNKVLPEDLDTTLCTHIVYSFVTLWEKGDLREIDQNQKDLFRRFTDLKKKNKDLKILLSIGKTDGLDSSIFSSLTTTDSKKEIFLNSVVSYIETYNFDGINIEWFFPAEKDKVNYIKLLQDLRKKCNEKGWILTATVSSLPENTGYDGKEMSKYLDWIILRTYDFYGPWGVNIGQNSPLYASSVENGWERDHLNIEASAKNWINIGVPRSKIVLSVAFYGRSFILKDKDQHGIHAPFAKAGREDGFVRYSQLCNVVNNWTSVWDDEQKSVYSYNEDEWIGYDDKETIRIKAAYVKDNGFLGVNVWPVDGDDVYGKCGPKQILLKQVHKGLG